MFFPFGIIDNRSSTAINSEEIRFYCSYCGGYFIGQHFCYEKQVIIEKLDKIAELLNYYRAM